MRPPAPALVVMAAAATIAGCGYALVGTGKGSLPEDVKTVWVPDRLLNVVVR